MKELQITMSSWLKTKFGDQRLLFSLRDLTHCDDDETAWNNEWMRRGVRYLDWNSIRTLCEGWVMVNNPAIGFYMHTKHTTSHHLRTYTSSWLFGCTTTKWTCPDVTMKFQTKESSASDVLSSAPFDWLKDKSIVERAMGQHRKFLV